MMFKTRKLTAAMLAAGLMSTSMLVSNAGAQVAVSDNGAGSAVVVPYYTVNEGWRTLLNVSNTSDDSMVIKVRLHEARNSRDVLDFNVALSPRDVWTAWVSMDENGRPFLQTEDTSCTIPLSVRDSGTAASELAYSGGWADDTNRVGNRDHEATDGNIDRMSEGYVEILTMGMFEGDESDENVGVPYYAKHVDGVPRDCGVVENAFQRTASEWLPQNDWMSSVGGEDGSGLSDVELTIADNDRRNARVDYGPISGDALKVNASLVNRDNGIAAGIESLHIAGYGAGTGENGGTRNFVTAQRFPWFLEPTLVTDSRGLWTMGELENVEAGIGASAVANEWATNPATGATSEWVVTFPTKRFRVDNDFDSIQAACNAYRNPASLGDGALSGTSVSGTPVNTVNECVLAPFDNRFQDGDDGQSAIEVEYEIWDREEGSFRVETDGVTVSPAPPPEVTIDTLIYEANVVKIGRDVSSVDSVLGSAIARSVDTNQLVSDANTGWALMEFDSAVPVTGFLFKQRDFGDTARNYGQATEHAYDRVR